MIVAEDTVCEDAKYYPMMKVLTPGNGPAEPMWDEVQLRFGKLLLEKKHPVLRQLLQRDLKLTEDILNNLPLGGGERIENRKVQLNQEIRYIREGLKYYEM